MQFSPQGPDGVATADPSEPATPDPPSRSPGAGRLRIGVGLLIGAGAIYAVVSSAGGFADSLAEVTSARPGWLAAGAAAEVVSYVVLGLLLRCLVGGQVNRRTAVRLGLVVAGLGNILPAAPAEGLALAGAELRRRGVTGRQSRIALGFMQWLSVRILFGVAAIDALAVALLAGPRITGRVVLAASGLVVLWLLVFTAWLASRRQTMEFVALVAGRLQFWRAATPVPQLRAQGAAWHGDIHRTLGSPRAKGAFGGLALTSCLADALCFRCALVAVGVQPKPGLLLFAYAVAMIAALVPFIPAGLGVVETVVPALLHHAGVPLPTALAGVLAYRALGTLLPAISGTIALVRLRMTFKAPAGTALAEAVGTAVRSERAEPLR
jgi:uncharacterized membrane protein YbhN (UPF0104 family)